MIKHVAFKGGSLKIIRPGSRMEYNRNGYGIFRTVNHFGYKDSLKKDNVTGIIYWVIDIDEGDKGDLLKELLRAALRPTVIIETKAGYHAYWRAIDGTKENYRRIEKGISLYLYDRGVVCDPSVCNYNRFLRSPGYQHQKDPNNPFTIKTSWKDIGLRYSEVDMMKSFPYTEVDNGGERKNGDGDIYNTIEREGISIIGDRCMCPIKVKREGRSHKSEGRGTPAMQLFNETNTFHCYACSISGTSEKLEEILR